LSQAMFQSKAKRGTQINRSDPFRPYVQRLFQVRIRRRHISSRMVQWSSLWNLLGDGRIRRRTI
jgi:hypothetical protein